MPELPEVETICRGLKNSLTDEKIVKVEVLRKDSIAYPKAMTFGQALEGHVIKNISRRGKYLLIHLSGKAGLVVHLGMSGRLLVINDPKKSSRFLRVCIYLKSGQELRFEDMRVFGRVWYVPAGYTFEQIIPGLAQLGKEPLTGLTGEIIKELFLDKKQAIKSSLLDQRLLAGIGNIYADESLFRAGIHPQTAAGKLTLTAANRLAQSIQVILNNAITLGGSTLRDYTNSEGVNGNYQHTAFVYGRFGKNCKKCKKIIERIKLAGRSTHFCPFCQPLNQVAERLAKDKLTKRQTKATGHGTKTKAKA